MVKLAVVVGAVTAYEPGHPLRRLNKLVKFGKEWVETNIPQAASVRNKKWQAKWETNAARMEEAFNRCGTYDSNARKRRQLDSYTSANLSEDAFGRSIERNQAVKNMYFFSIWKSERIFATNYSLEMENFAILFFSIMFSLSCLRFFNEHQSGDGL